MILVAYKDLSLRRGPPREMTQKLCIISKLEKLFEPL